MEKLKVAICGLGGLGRLHANNLALMEDVEIVSVCDINPEKLEAKEIETNLGTNASVFDIRRSRTYTDFDLMMKKERIDVLVAALPTNLHAEFAIKAMRKGCNVFSEKPMALTVKECDRIIDVSRKTGKKFMAGQCLRFWPEYEMLSEAVKDGRYGRLKSLTMTRIGAYSTWANPNWFMDGASSGGAILDLHLHDADWAYHALGIPEFIWASGIRGKTGEYDDVTAIWSYPEFHVTLRGSWMYQDFVMSFQAFFDEVSMDFGVHPDPCLRVKTRGAKEYEKINVPGVSGYFKELRYFFDAVRGISENTICTPESTRNSVQMVYKEKESIRKGRQISNFGLIGD